MIFVKLDIRAELFPRKFSYLTDRCTQQCEPQCSFTKYDLRITTAKFPNPGYKLVNKVNYPGTNMNISHMRQNYAELVLKFDTLLTEKITLHPKYDLVTATSSVGGLLGLLIGGSLVTCYELLELISLVTHTLCMYTCRKKGFQNPSRATLQNL